MINFFVDDTLRQQINQFISILEEEAMGTDKLNIVGATKGYVVIDRNHLKGEELFRRILFTARRCFVDDSY
jgi:hypothetical protein